MKIKRKKIRNFKLIYIFLAAIFSLVTIYIFFFVDPELWQSLYYAPFMAGIFLTILFLLMIFLRKKIVAILISLGIITILFLRIFGFKEIYYPILISGIVITLSYFFTIEEEADKLKKLKIDKEKNADKQEKN